MIVSEKQKWRERAAGTLENLEYKKNCKLKIRDWYRLFGAIAAALVSISIPEEKDNDT